MAAARFSSDLLEMFYGSLVLQEENQRQKRPIAPARVSQESKKQIEPVRRKREIRRKEIHKVTRNNYQNELLWPYALIFI